MFRTPSSPNEERQPPFIISIQHQDKSRNGHWRPDAAVQITAALRTGGFLHAIAPEELKSLLWLFSFLTPNGDCVPSLAQLASAMQVSEGKARLRMERLAGWKWQGQAIVLATQRGESGEAYAPAPGFVPLHEEAPARLANEQVPIRAAQRDAVIAHSRARYARPRAEVEAQIARDMAGNTRCRFLKAGVRLRLLRQRPSYRSRSAN